MRSPLRVAQPGTINETCRLCERPLELSVENPRRICAHCGEINLPAEHVSEQPAARAPQTASSSRNIGPSLLGLFALGAASVAVPAVATSLVTTAGSAPGRFDTASWLSGLVLIALPVSLLASVVMAWLVAGSRWAGYRLAAVAAWVSGWAVAAVFSAVLVFYLLLTGYGR